MPDPRLQRARCVCVCTGAGARPGALPALICSTNSRIRACARQCEVCLAYSERFREQRFDILACPHVCRRTQRNIWSIVAGGQGTAHAHCERRSGRWRGPASRYSPVCRASSAPCAPGMSCCRVPWKLCCPTRDWVRDPKQETNRPLTALSKC